METWEVIAGTLNFIGFIFVASIGPIDDLFLYYTKRIDEYGYGRRGVTTPKRMLWETKWGPSLSLICLLVGHIILLVLSVIKAGLI